MKKPNARSLETWFDNCGGWSPRHDLKVLRQGIEAGLLDAQNEYGSTALCLAVSSEWIDGVRELLRAGANTELYYFRTGETPLCSASFDGDATLMTMLSAAGADPDAPNHWGVTPRNWAARRELKCFDNIPVRKTPRPPPRIQNAEHLADHYHPRFKIPSRKERESIQPGQAVNLYVYGPRTAKKEDSVKVRVTARLGNGPDVLYTADVETPPAATHLVARTVEFGPEHIATVYLPVKKNAKTTTPAISGNKRKPARKTASAKKTAPAKKAKGPTKTKKAAKLTKSKRKR